MNNSYTIRKAEESDVKAATALCLEVNPLSQTGEQNSIEFLERFFLGALGSEDAALMVAEARSQIVGFAYAEIEHSSDDCVQGPYASFDLLGVDPRWRGKGIAKALIDTVESWAHEKGMKVIQLAVAESNLSALKLYESLGYRTVMRKMQKEL